MIVARKIEVYLFLSIPSGHVAKILDLKFKDLTIQKLSGFQIFRIFFCKIKGR